MRVLTFIPCRKCRNHFLETFGHCPHCKCRAPKGSRMVRLKVMSLFLAVTALVLTAVLVNHGR